MGGQGKRSNSSEFSKKLFQIGGNVGVDMTFARDYNEAAREEARLERERREMEHGDDVTEGDEQYFDDVEYSDVVDSWGPERASSKASSRQRNDENEPPHKTLDLSGVSSVVAWGEGKEPIRLNSSQSKMRPRSGRDEREQSRREGR